MELKAAVAAPARTEHSSREAPSHTRAGGGGGGRRRRRRERLCRRLLVPSAEQPPPPPFATILPPWCCRGPPCSSSCPAPRRSRSRAEGAVAASRPARADERRVQQRCLADPRGSARRAARATAPRAAGGRAAPGPGPPSLPRPGPAARAGAAAGRGEALQSPGLAAPVELPRHSGLASPVGRTRSRSPGTELLGAPNPGFRTLHAVATVPSGPWPTTTCCSRMCTSCAR